MPKVLVGGTWGGTGGRGPNDSLETTPYQTKEVLPTSEFQARSVPPLYMDPR
jgi:hypothetical protein